MGMIKVFSDFLSVFYCLFIGLLVRQVIKNPIEKLKKYTMAAHFVSWSVSFVLTLILVFYAKFGVEDDF